MTEIADRVAAVRREMARRDLQALIIPRADEYLGEYIPARNERLCWISGFTGSAGVVILFADRAAIFVDGRYTVQVRKQVPEGLFDILHLVDEPHLPWLAGQLSAGARVGYDPRLHPFRWQQDAVKVLDRSGLELVELEENLVDLCWTDRPPTEVHTATLQPESLAGRSSEDKRRSIGRDLEKQGVDAALVFAPDSLAWLLNIRGRDVPCVPVVLGFGLLFADGRLQFFTDPAKIPPGFAAHVGTDVEVLPESASPGALDALKECRVLADPVTANAWCQLRLKRAGAELVAADDPVATPKACKNAAEVEGMRQAHQRDAVAVVRFLAWLDREVAAGRLASEGELADRLHRFRAEDGRFTGPSFDTISAAAGNAAMAHYNHLNFDAVSRLEMDSVYLVDSGGQYPDGTTDITRTVAVGNPGDAVRRHFTLVLKGHIALDQVVFPAGTNGTQLDVLARQFLWQAGLDYDHGTGHGVGAYLSVHEGPQRISKVLNGHALQPGMVVSNEPGYYRDGEYGIRCENLVVVSEALERHADGPQMFCFQALTLVPFDHRLIDPSLMTQAEIDWIDRYHVLAREAIGPLLEGDDRAWLDQATAAIGA